VSGYRTDRSRVNGLGAAHHGAATWIKERVSSIALVPLVLWGLFSVGSLAGSGYEGAVLWLHAPVNAILLLLLVLTGIFHMHLGMRVVLEDYIHKPFGRATVLLLNLFFCTVLAATAGFSILKVAFGGGFGV
jgi:succinate dehydrogenase / fumarate reductase membrane anchor subunit